MLIEIIIVLAGFGLSIYTLFLMDGLEKQLKDVRRENKMLREWIDTVDNRRAEQSCTTLTNLKNNNHEIDSLNARFDTLLDSIDKLDRDIWDLRRKPKKRKRSK
jgi:uncharacterized protein YdcH (DUF465 family)